MTDRIHAVSLNVSVKRVSDKRSSTAHRTHDHAVRDSDARRTNSYWINYGFKWRFMYRVNVYLKPELD